MTGHKRQLLVATGDKTRELAQHLHRRLSAVCERYMLENNANEQDAIIVMAFALGVVSTTYKNVLHPDFYADCVRAFEQGRVANTLAALPMKGQA